MRGAVLLLIATGWLAPAGPAAAQERGPWQPSEEEITLGAQARELLNEARRNEGLGPLRESAALDTLAYQHSHEMASRDSVSHFSHLYGVNTRSRVRLAFPQLQQFGENVARNRDLERLHEALMNSRGHRLNRMDSSFTHVGIGIARNGPYQLYLTEVFARPAVGETLQIDVLYTAIDPALLQRDEPVHGEVLSETVRIGSPGQDDPEYWTRRGIDSFVAGRYDEAVSLFERALRIDPRYGYARFNLARAVLRAGDPARSLEILEPHLVASPEDTDAWWTRGSAALAAGRFSLAEQAFRRVIEDRPREASPWYNLGLSLEYQSRLDEAERAYAQALHLDPELHAARDGLTRLRR